MRERNTQKWARQRAILLQALADGWSKTVAMQRARISYMSVTWHSYAKKDLEFMQIFNDYNQYKRWVGGFDNTSME